MERQLYGSAASAFGKPAVELLAAVGIAVADCPFLEKRRCCSGTANKLEYPVVAKFSSLSLEDSRHPEPALKGYKDLVVPPARSEGFRRALLALCTKRVLDRNTLVRRGYGEELDSSAVRL